MGVKGKRVARRAIRRIFWVELSDKQGRMWEVGGSPGREEAGDDGSWRRSASAKFHTEENARELFENIDILLHNCRTIRMKSKQLLSDRLSILTHDIQLN